MKGRHSITKRLFLNVTMIIVVFTLVLLVANTLLLKPMYLKAIENRMVDALSGIENIDSEVITDTWLDDVRLLNIGNDFDTVVVLDDQVIYSASPEVGFKDIDGIDHQLDPKIRPDKNKLPFDSTSERRMLTEGIERVMVIDPNPKDNNSILIYGRQIDGGLYVYMFQPLEPVNDSVAVANKLLVLCAVIFLVLLIFVTMRLSRQFTKPIKDIEQQVDALTRLEFNRKVAITTGDELEDLGNDINQLSETLEKSLNQLNQQNKQLAKDVRSQKRFISNASHELRTPLALIKGYSEEIEGGYVKNQDQQKKYMAYISEEATKMSRLLDEILELSRLESGRMTLREEPINLCDSINGFLDKYDGFVKVEQLNIQVTANKEIVGLFDVVRFEQILANYISNAAKYGDDLKRISVKVEVQEKRVIVKVFNYGTHIGQETMDHLWDGFYMADEARSGNKNSYGLGLSIVKAIQEVGDNRYGAKNVDGGVEFWIDMALAE